jgi:hypothetical protein
MQSVNNSALLMEADITAESALLPPNYTMNDLAVTLSCVLNGLFDLLGLIGRRSLFSWRNMQGSYEITGR